MGAARTDMHRLQELVRLARMGTGSREVARLLAMSPKTELKYRRALEGAGLLAGSPTLSPSSRLCVLRSRLPIRRPRLGR